MIRRLFKLTDCHMGHDLVVSGSTSLAGAALLPEYESWRPSALSTRTREHQSVSKRILNSHLASQRRALSLALCLALGILLLSPSRAHDLAHVRI